jgi:hypothetical protein
MLDQVLNLERLLTMETSDLVGVEDLHDDLTWAFELAIICVALLA